MKKFYLTMVAMLCGVAAMAQSGFKAKSIENAKAGETVDLEVEVMNVAPLKAYSFRLQMPEGFTAKAKKFISLARCSEEASDEGWVDINILTTADGNKQFSAYTADPKAYNNFEGNEGVAMIIPITIADDVAEGVYTIQLYKGQVDDLVDGTANIPVGVGMATGITTATADDANAPIYNVAGQIVSKAQKGIYIQNGKKVLK